MTTNHIEDAQNAVIGALVAEASRRGDGGEIEVAEVIRKEAAKLCKKYGVSEVPGLPATWSKRKRIPDYDR
jgi:hypothetical protein